MEFILSLRCALEVGVQCELGGTRGREAGLVKAAVDSYPSLGWLLQVYLDGGVREAAFVRLCELLNGLNKSQWVL